MKTYGAPECRCMDCGVDPVLKLDREEGLFYFECPSCGTTSNAWVEKADAAREWDASNGEKCERCGVYCEETWSGYCPICYDDMTGGGP